MWYQDFQNRVRRGVLALAVVLAVAAAAQAQQEESAKPPTAAEGAVAPSELEQLLPRLTGRDRELVERRIKTGKLPEETKDQRAIVLVDFAHLASPYYGSPTNKRFAAIRLAAVNLTGRDVVLTRDDMRLTADGQEYSVSEPPQQFQNVAIQVDKQSHQLKTLGTPAETTVAPGAAGRVWLLFPELPPGNHVPPMKLKIKAGDAERELDINALQRDLLGMKTERLGPRECLGLVTLSGVLNSINVGSLVDELDRLTAEKVVRVVIHWAEGASLADASLGAWMQNSVNALGRQPVESQYPPLPVIIRELHLAGLPTNGGNGSGRTYYGNSNSVLPLGPRIHGTMPEAVVAALSSAYETVPLPELLAAIQTGRRLERAAAIVGGAARLSREQLPLLLKLADDEDDLIRQSALSALSQFGERAAIEKLAEHVRRNVDPNSSIAVASLAGSRYAAAHTALLELLKSEPPEVKKSIVRVLASFPRPIWSDVIYEFTRDGRSGLNVEALNALVQVGHPKLLSVLADALRGDDAELRQQAFSVLATRTDRESEELALEYTLEQLKTVQPTPQMLALLNRVKDPRALPLLMARFDGSSNKSALIQTLALIGDRGTARFLGEKFESLQNHERGEALRAIARLDTGVFRRLAAQALLASDSSTVGAAVQGLQEDGGPDAVRIMIDALDKSTQSFTWSYVCNALAMIGTPAARMALLKAREGENADKRNFAVNALQSLRMRSPGYQYIYQGQAFARKEQWKEAIEQFDMAIQLDPQLPDAYSERGQALLRQDKFADAGKDFARAVELDPYNAFALTGLCTVLVVVEGKHGEAVARVEENRAKFPNNALFNYNAACVYGRALERVDKDEKLADREALRKKYREAAIADLKKAMELGFQDVNWMKNDPDLKSLHDAPAFQELLKSAPTAQRAAGRRLRLPAQAIRTAQD